MSHDFRLDGITVNITISIGITSCTSFDRLNAKQIIHSADSALYRAKRLGKNRVCFNEDSESIGEEVRILSNV